MSEIHNITADAVLSIVPVQRCTMYMCLYATGNFVLFLFFRKWFNLDQTPALKNRHTRSVLLLERADELHAKAVKRENLHHTPCYESVFLKLVYIYI